MSEDYWDGATWVYHSIVANDDQGASTITWLIVPGAGNEMEILYGQLANLDTAGRAVSIAIETDAAGEELTRLVVVTLNAGAAVSFPAANVQAAGGSAAAPTRFILSGNMRLIATVASVALSQDAEFGLVCRIRGGVPTVTEAGGGTIVISELTEQVF